MSHSIRQAEHRPELKGLDPVALLLVPLAILLLGIIAIRAIVTAAVV
jgi:hypothetical protein